MTLTPDKRIAGLLAPLFALRGVNDLGIGDVGALREFVDWAAEAGFGLKPPTANVYKQATESNFNSPLGSKAFHFGSKDQSPAALSSYQQL